MRRFPDDRTVEPRDGPHFRSGLFSVTEVLDGDTVKLMAWLSVRLYGVDCPELGTHEGTDALQFTAAWLQKYQRSARMTIVGLDPYGRALVRITRRGGPSLNQALVDAGFATRAEL